MNKPNHHVHHYARSSCKCESLHTYIHVLSLCIRMYTDTVHVCTRVCICVCIVHVCRCTQEQILYNCPPAITHYFNKQALFCLHLFCTDAPVNWKQWIIVSQWLTWLIWLFMIFCVSYYCLSSNSNFFCKATDLISACMSALIYEL